MPNVCSLHNLNYYQNPPMNFATVPELLDELRAGRMVVIVDDEDRENEGDLIMVAECVRPADINFMVTHARGLVCLSLTRERCKQLNLPPMVMDNTSPHHTNFTVSIEAAEGVTTGISAYDRAHTIRTAVKPNAKAEDLSQPGHIFPLVAQPGGVLTRSGHTEAASDLALLAGFEPAGVLVEILNEDGSMARRAQLEVFAEQHGLKMGSIEELIRYRLNTEHTVERVDQRKVQTQFGEFELISYRDRISRDVHFAMVRGNPGASKPCLVRVHVKNLLTDVLALQRDDFSASVHQALQRVAEEGEGVVVILGEPYQPDQLLEKITQTTAASMNKQKEWRQNGVGAQILADLGLRQLRVLGTARRQVALAGFGLDVIEHVSLI
jgi:3,4-dihydroxy 2-butanone 4-phosphate synthase / GTP cyclohydrolase II